MLQRPDLFGVTLPGVGVMDMLRFNKFTIGWAWESDYGSPEKLEDFQVLVKYSPYHNIEKGECYPPTLITTSELDDRVVPSHSYKFAARMQEAQNCTNPILIRIETRAGHGAGTPRNKTIEYISDVYGFALHYLLQN
jgi:prolyl oligopeptidase